MIQANELRIGNWIFQKCTQEYRQIVWSDIRNIALQDDSANYKVEANDLEPIPLTPAILGKCGFELLPWGWVKLSSKEFGVRLKVNSFAYEVSGNNPVKLDYLHQLQNLYFALTSEELQITNL